jgi:hypothetical protein
LGPEKGSDWEAVLAITSFTFVPSLLPFCSTLSVTLYSFRYTGGRNGFLGNDLCGITSVNAKGRWRHKAYFPYFEYGGYKRLILTYFNGDVVPFLARMFPFNKRNLPLLAE